MVSNIMVNCGIDVFVGIKFSCSSSSHLFDGGKFQKGIPMVDGRSGCKLSHFIYWEAVICFQTCHTCFYTKHGFYSKWNTKSLKFDRLFASNSKSCKMPIPEIEWKIRNTGLILSQTILQNQYYDLLFYMWTCSYSR